LKKRDLQPHKSDFLKRSVLVKLTWESEKKRERFVSLSVSQKRKCFPRIKRGKHFPAIKV
jgi:hypothetical protein